MSYLQWDFAALETSIVEKYLIIPAIISTPKITPGMYTVIFHVVDIPPPPLSPLFSPLPLLPLLLLSPLPSSPSSACWRRDHAERPSFVKILKDIQCLEGSDFCTATSHEEFRTMQSTWRGEIQRKFVELKKMEHVSARGYVCMYVCMYVCSGDATMHIRKFSFVSSRFT